MIETTPSLQQVALQARLAQAAICLAHREAQAAWPHECQIFYCHSRLSNKVVRDRKQLSRRKSWNMHADHFAPPRGLKRRSLPKNHPMQLYECAIILAS